MKKLFCIIGRTCSGKTTLAKKVAEEFDLKVVKSYTTRPIRPNEDVYTSDHIFISEDEVKLFTGKIAAYTEINGYKYFTTKDMLFKSDIYVIDPNGYEELTNYINDNSLKIKLIPIYIVSDIATLEHRYMDRGNTRNEFWQRYESENKQFIKFEEEMDVYGTFVIKNYQLSYSFQELKKYVISKVNLCKKIEICIRKRFIGKI